MRLISHLALAVLASLFLGCTTSSKSSKIEYLTGGPEVVATEKEILDDISRTVYIKEIAPPTDLDKQAGRKWSERNTSTWVKVYPYTQPLLAQRIKNSVEAEGYKERWEADKIAAEIKERTTMQIRDLITSKQCFAFEINSGNLKALELKYWYGTLAQGEAKEDLKFSKGVGLVHTTRTTTVTNTGYGTAYATSYDSHHYFYYADACSSKPIDLGGEFSMSFEPRFDKGLIPTTLQWLDPKKKK